MKQEVRNVGKFSASTPSQAQIICYIVVLKVLKVFNIFNTTI